MLNNRAGALFNTYSLSIASPLSARRWLAFHGTRATGHITLFLATRH
ncbi:MAG TPA: hypothetical protein VN788_01465 [Verrucomicrobiae bacterium]|nr:hypothetical protein [Verrucomicrobiae bacterium]